MLRNKLLLIIITVGLLSVIGHAQYDVDDRLKLEITPYVWMTTMNGDLTIKGETRPINFTFEDFFKFSNLGLNGRVELKKRRWAILFDYNYVDLLKGETYTELVLSELAFAWRLTKSVELIVGGRYFKSEVEYKNDQIKKGHRPCRHWWFWDWIRICMESDGRCWLSPFKHHLFRGISYLVCEVREWLPIAFQTSPF
jgi:hypothetical protein